MILCFHFALFALVGIITIMKELFRYLLAIFGISELICRYRHKKPPRLEPDFILRRLSRVLPQMPKRSLRA